MTAYYFFIRAKIVMDVVAHRTVNVEVTQRSNHYFKTKIVLLEVRR